MEENSIKISVNDHVLEDLKETVSNSHMELDKFLELLLIEMSRLSYVPKEHDYNRNGKLLINKLLTDHGLHYHYRNAHYCFVSGSNVLYIKDIKLNLKHTAYTKTTGTTISFKEIQDFCISNNMKLYFAFIWNLTDKERTVSILDMDIFKEKNALYQTFYKTRNKDNYELWDYIVDFRGDYAMAINDAHNHALKSLIDSPITDNLVIPIKTKKRF